MFKSPEGLTRAAARVQGQPASKEEDGGSSEESGPRNLAKRKTTKPATKTCHGFWTTTPPLRMLTDHLMCRDGRSEESLLERRAVSTLAARRNYQTALAHAPSGRKHRNRRCPGRVLEQLLCPKSSASPWFAASCCRDGSLAVIQPT